jgi:hypothetical protein
MWAHSCCLTPPHRSRTGTTGWGAWRMLWRVRERSRSSSPSQLWVARPLSPYNVIIYLFCTELILYSKDVTFDPVPWFIICVRLGPSTHGDYVRARVLVPRNPGVTHGLARPLDTTEWMARDPLRGLYKVPLASKNPLQFWEGQLQESLVWPPSQQNQPENLLACLLPYCPCPFRVRYSSTSFPN